jgi:cell division protein FtsI (penicillin-binding protein 3)
MTTVAPSRRRSRPPRRNRPIPLQRVSQVRLLIVWGLMVSGTVGLGSKLVHLQVLQRNFLKQEAVKQQQHAQPPHLSRRPVVDQSGNLLAVDEEVFTLYVHPLMFKRDGEKQTPGAIARLLAPLLSQSEPELRELLSSRDTGIKVSDTIPQDVKERIEGLYIDGVDFERHPRRVYPQGSLYGNVIGFLDHNRKGQSGIEYSQQVLLTRSMPSLNLRRSGDGEVLADSLPSGFLHKDDLQLQLTLNGELQRATRRALEAQITRYRAKRATALVMDVRDGSLLAMVTLPTYDPNAFHKANPQLFSDWAIHDLYEPGSTFKPINVAIALEDKEIRPDETVYDEGRIMVGGWPINNHDFSSRGGRGSLTIPEVLQYSSNVAMVHIMERLDASRYYEWLKKLGLDQAVGTDLPFATPGQTKDRSAFINQEIEPATTAFGQGFSLTPLKLLQLHATLANGGRLVTPHVVAGLVNAEGELYWRPQRPEAKRIFSTETSRLIMQMMESVVSSGSGKSSIIRGYKLAGKTGTAQKAENGIYISGARITSFVGILPANAPRYAALVVVDEPQGDDAYGSTVAAPVVKQIMETLIALEGLPPNGPVGSHGASVQQRMNANGRSAVKPESHRD